MAQTPYETAATEVLGESALPRTRTFFTPSAFGRSMDIVTRANLAKRDLNKTIDYAKRENEIRGLLLDRQEQDLRSVQFEQRRALEEMQPQVRADLENIDPFDDDAFEALTNVEGLITQPQDLRRVRAMRTLAGMYRRQKEDAIEQMARAGLDDDEMADVIQKADEQVKAGDPYAFSKVMAPVIDAKRKKLELDREVEDEQKETSYLLSALAQRGTTEADMSAAIEKAKKAFSRGDRLAFRKAAAVLPPYNEVEAARSAARRAPIEAAKEVDSELKSALEAVRKTGLKDAQAIKPKAREDVLKALPKDLKEEDKKAFIEDPRGFLAGMDETDFKTKGRKLGLIADRLDALEALRAAMTKKAELEDENQVDQGPNRGDSGGAPSGSTPATPSGFNWRKFVPDPEKKP